MKKTYLLTLWLLFTASNVHADFLGMDGPIVSPAVVGKIKAIYRIIDDGKVQLKSPGIFDAYDKYTVPLDEFECPKGQTTFILFDTNGPSKVVCTEVKRS